MNLLLSKHSNLIGMLAFLVTSNISYPYILYVHIVPSAIKGAKGSGSLYVIRFRAIEIIRKQRPNNDEKQSDNSITFVPTTKPSNINSFTSPPPIPFG